MFSNIAVLLYMEEASHWIRVAVCPYAAVDRNGS